MTGCPTPIFSHIGRHLRLGSSLATDVQEIMAKLDANAVIRTRIDQDTKALLERAARAEGLLLSEWMRLHLIRIAEARRRRVAAR